MENLFLKVTADEARGGSKKYRCIFVKNTNETLPLQSAKLYIESMTPYTTLRTQLDGNGVETTVHVIDNAAFPSKGAFMVDDEEIAYTGKSGESPTCSFTNCTRGSNTTAKALHTVGSPVEDNQFRMAIEAPNVEPDGYVQNIADEYTDPIGLTFTAPRDYDTGISLGDLEAGDICAIWLRRIVPKGSWAVALINPIINVDGITDA